MKLAEDEVVIRKQDLQRLVDMVFMQWTDVATAALKLKSSLADICPSPPPAFNKKTKPRLRVVS